MSESKVVRGSWMTYVRCGILQNTDINEGIHVLLW